MILFVFLLLVLDNTHQTLNHPGSDAHYRGAEVTNDPRIKLTIEIKMERKAKNGSLTETSILEYVVLNIADARQKVVETLEDSFAKLANPASPRQDHMLIMVNPDSLMSVSTFRCMIAKKFDDLPDRFKR